MQENLVVTTGLMRSGTTWLAALLGKLTMTQPLNEPWCTGHFGFGSHRERHWPPWVYQQALDIHTQGLDRRTPGDPPLSGDTVDAMRACHLRLVKGPFSDRRVFRFMACRIPEVWDDLATNVQVVYIYRGLAGWLSCVARSPVRSHTQGLPWPLWVVNGARGPWDGREATVVAPDSPLAPLVRAAFYHQALSSYLWENLVRYCQNFTAVSYESLLANPELEAHRLAQASRPGLSPNEALELLTTNRQGRPAPSWLNSPYCPEQVLRAVDLFYSAQEETDPCW